MARAPISEPFTERELHDRTRLTFEADPQHRGHLGALHSDHRRLARECLRLRRAIKRARHFVSIAAYIGAIDTCNKALSVPAAKRGARGAK